MLANRVSQNLFTSQYRRALLTLLFVVMVVITPTLTQDAEITEEPVLGQVTTTAIPSATLLPPTFTPTPSPTLTLHASATLLPTMQSISATLTSISGTHTVTPTLTPIIELTEDIIPISATVSEVSPDTLTPTLPTTISATVTGSESATPTITLDPISGTEIAPSPTPASGTMVSISPTLSSISPTISPTIMPTISATQIMTTITPTFQPTATVGGIALRYIQGIANYQNRVTDDAGILLQIYDNDLTLVSEVKTNIDGIYNIAVPMEGAFWMVFSAEGYRTERIYNTETVGLADVTLLAGDLNADECINFDDITLMRGEFDNSNTLFDLNDDKQIDISDVAMLAGNLNPDCVVNIEATSTPEATFTAISPTLESSFLTPTPMTTISPTATELAIAETTELPTFEAESTDEATASD